MACFLIVSILALLRFIPYFYKVIITTYTVMQAVLTKVRVKDILGPEEAEKFFQRGVGKADKSGIDIEDSMKEFQSRLKQSLECLGCACLESEKSEIEYYTKLVASYQAQLYGIHAAIQY
jgi:hypothetical protein